MNRFALSLVVALVATLTACSGGSEYAGQFDGCDNDIPSLDVVVLLDGPDPVLATGGYLLVTLPDDSTVMLPIDGFDVDKHGAITFSAELDGGDAVNLTFDVALERDGDDELSGDVEINDGGDKGTCDVSVRLDN